MLNERQKNDLNNFFMEIYQSLRVATIGCAIGAILVLPFMMREIYRRKFTAQLYEAIGQEVKTGIGGMTFLFILLVIATIVLIVMGYQKFYGDSTPRKCLASGRYTVENIVVSSQEPYQEKKPMLIRDNLGTQYRCIRYLDYKKGQPGTTMLGVVLENGIRIALMPEE